MRTTALLWQAGIYSGKTSVKMKNKLVRSFFLKNETDMQKDVVEINLTIRLYYWDTFIKLFCQGWCIENGHLWMAIPLTLAKLLTWINWNEKGAPGKFEDDAIQVNFDKLWGYKNSKGYGIKWRVPRTSGPLQKLCTANLFITYLKQQSWAKVLGSTCNSCLLTVKSKHNKREDSKLKYTCAKTSDNVYLCCMQTSSAKQEP